MTTSLLIINCLECNCGLIDYWLFEHITREWWHYCSCIYPTFVYVSLKGIGVVRLDMYTWGLKDFHKCWSGSLAKRRLCLGPAGVINCTPLSKKKKKEFGRILILLLPRTPWACLPEPWPSSQTPAARSLWSRTLTPCCPVPQHDLFPAA